MGKFFVYKRKEVINKVDEKGKKIPILDENQVETGSFKTEEKVYHDSFNLDRVIRTYVLENETILVLLDDGHEDLVPVPELKNKHKPPTPDNIIEGRRRKWIQSEIIIEDKQDLENLISVITTY